MSTNTPLDNGAAVPADATAPAPEPGPPASPGGSGRRVLLVAGTVLGIVAALWAALYVVDLLLSRTETTHETYDPAATVELVADGHVTVVAAEGDVEVDRIARGGLTRPTYSVEELGDRLVVRHQCDWWLLWQCSGALEVTLPADTEVVVRTENGDVVASGLARDVDLSSGNGQVEASGIGGGVGVRSSNGDVSVRDAGGDVVARTGNGRVEVEDAGGAVVADSSNGDITVRAAGNDVQARTGNGRVDVGDVDGDVSARSSNGRVDVDGATGNVRAETSNGDVTVHGDGEPVALTISTSNGQQVIEGATDPDADREVWIRSSNGNVSYLDSSAG